MHAMETAARAITWDAPEHHHVEKGNDWYLILVIIVFALFVAAIILGNVLFALLIAVSGGAFAIAATKPPKIIPFSVSVRGVRIGERLYPYATLDAYHIDEDDPKGPQLLLRSQRRFMPLLVVPIPEEYVDDIEDLIKERLDEEHLEEPVIMKILELFGF